MGSSIALPLNESTMCGRCESNVTWLNSFITFVFPDFNPVTCEFIFNALFNIVTFIILLDYLLFRFGIKFKFKSINDIVNTSDKLINRKILILQDFVDKQFIDVTTFLDEHNKQFILLNNFVDDLNETFIKLNSTIDKHTSQIIRLNSIIDEYDEQFIKLYINQDKHDEKFIKLNSIIDEHDEQFIKLNIDINGYDKKFIDLSINRDKHDNFPIRINSIIDGYNDKFIEIYYIINNINNNLRDVKSAISLLDSERIKDNNDTMMTRKDMINMYKEIIISYESNGDGSKLTNQSIDQLNKIIYAMQKIEDNIEWTRNRTLNV